jgi:hypothetical protein
MAILLELPPEIEADLAAQAQARGLRLDAYVKNLLRQQASIGHSEPTMGLDQFEAELDALAQGSETLPYLPPEAMTRESLYQDHD